MNSEKNKIADLYFAVLAFLNGMSTVKQTIKKGKCLTHFQMLKPLVRIVLKRFLELDKILS